MESQVSILSVCRSAAGEPGPQGPSTDRQTDRQAGLGRGQGRLGRLAAGAIDRQTDRQAGLGRGQGRLRGGWRRPQRPTDRQTDKLAWGEAWGGWAEAPATDRQISWPPSLEEAPATDRQTDIPGQGGEAASQAGYLSVCRCCFGKVSATDRQISQAREERQPGHLSVCRWGSGGGASDRQTDRYPRAGEGGSSRASSDRQTDRYPGLGQSARIRTVSRGFSDRQTDR